MISISSSDNFMDLISISMENEKFFEKSKAMKQEIAKSIIKFNNKPELGVKNLISIGFLEPKE